MKVSFEFVLAYCSIGSVLIPLSIAIPHWKSMESYLKLIRIILVLSLATDMLSFALVKYSINTYLIINIFLIVQFSILLLVVKQNINQQKAISTAFVLILLLSILNFSFFQGPWVLNTFSNVVASLFLISFCLIYFSKLLNELPIVHVNRSPMLWIGFAILTYYAGNFFLFLVKNYLTYGEAGSHKIMWVLHNFLNITKNILFAVALWQSYRSYKKMKSFTSSSLALSVCSPLLLALLFLL